MVDRCKYCGAKLAEEYRGVHAYECGSEYYSEDGNWSQMRACCEAEEKAKQGPRIDVKYAAQVNAACWLVSRAGKIAKRIEGLSPKQRHAVENEIVWIGRRLYDRVRKGGEQ